MRVIDDEQVRTAARYRSAHARREVLAKHVRLPPARGLRIFLQVRLREDFLVLWVGYKVSDLPTEADGKLGIVGGLNDLELRVPPQEPRRHEVGRELRLRVARGHVDDEALELAPGNSLQLFRDDAVVPALDEVLVDVVRERHEVVLRLLPRVELLPCLGKQKQLFEGCFWYCLKTHAVPTFGLPRTGRSPRVTPPHKVRSRARQRDES